MALLNFIGLFNKGSSMWHVVFCSDLDFHVTGWNFEEILQHLKKEVEKDF